jgi:hypothetical protein
MGSGAMIYVPSFIKIGSGVQKLIGGIDGHTNKHTHTHTRPATWSLKPTIFFQNKESRLKTLEWYFLYFFLRMQELNNPNWIVAFILDVILLLISSYNFQL